MEGTLKVIWPNTLAVNSVTYSSTRHSEPLQPDLGCLHGWGTTTSLCSLCWWLFQRDSPCQAFLHGEGCFPSTSRPKNSRSRGIFTTQTHPQNSSHQLTRTSAPALCFLSQSQTVARMGRHRARSYSKAPTHTHQPKPPVPSAPPALTHGEIWQLVCTAVNQPLPSPSCHCPVPATANLRPNLHQLMRNTFTPSPPHHLPSRHPPRSLG